MTQTLQPTPAVTPPPRRAANGPRLAHLRALDGLRGVAVLAVVCYHFAPDVAPGGFLGVDLFFVLSGFLITSLLVSEWRSRSTVSLTSFWARRARRLVPALLLVLVAVAVYALLVPEQADGQRFGVDGLAALGYVANWRFISSGQSYIDQFLHQGPSPLRHTWSLAIEEQFYLVWPIVVLLVGLVVGRVSRRAPWWRGRRLQRAVLVLCLVLAAVSLARMASLQGAGEDLNRIYYGTDSRAFIILFGAALGALSAGAPVLRGALRRVAVGVGMVAAVALVVAVAWVTATSSWLYEGGYALVAVAMVLVLLAAAQPGSNPLARLLEARPIVGLGLISYGVYLWHWPISLWITGANTGLDDVSLFVTRAFATLAVAILSFFLLEQPIRTGRLRVTRGRSGVVTALVAVVSVACLLLVPALALSTTRTAPQTSAPASEVVDVRAGYAAAPRCDRVDHAAAPVEAGRRLTIQLEGNSLAGEIRTCLRRIMAPRGVRFETYNPPDFLICKELPGIRRQVQRTKPDAGILFAFVAYDGRCGEPWHWPVDELVKIWKQAGMHVYLVPSTPFAPGSPEADNLSEGPRQEAFYYQSLANADPEHVTILDAGAFVRSDTGQYLWRMPCLTGGEAGCAADGTVGVRYVDGLHFCTDPDFAGRGCELPRYQAGERRAAASVGIGLIRSLTTRAAATVR
jgi:peptidoglycan/LPS O-acetylase OafA/YrhL